MPSQLLLTESDQTQKNHALLSASEKGVLTAATRLLENGADLHAYDTSFKTPLHLAVLHGHINLVQLYICKKQATLHEEDVDGMQPLHYAAKTGNSQVTQMLLHASANVKAVDKKGNTALHWAAFSGDEWTIYLIMNSGGDTKIKNRDGEMPVRLARRQQNLQSMRRLQGLIVEPPNSANEVSIMPTPS